jgi:hypothetical protein
VGDTGDGVGEERRVRSLRRERPDLLVVEHARVRVRVRVSEESDPTSYRSNMLGLGLG